MSYYNGTAASLADLRTALLTHAVADGWTLTGDVLSKAGVFFRIQVNATNITCLGCEDNAVANPAPNVVMIGRIFERSGYTTREISFPCNYEVFGFAQELYLVVNYDASSYQWMAFGKTTVPGVPGQGGWCGATLGSSYISDDTTAPIRITPIDGGGIGNNKYTAAALFYASSNGAYKQSWNCFVNHGLDGQGWIPDTGTGTDPIGIEALVPLLSLQPSAWNTESVLLPLRRYQQRPSFKASLVADLEHARHMRIGNLAPGDILTLGSDQWKIFPWYIKNSASRDGGTGINHTGTMGWAIRYEGP